MNALETRKMFLIKKKDLIYQVVRVQIPFLEQDLITVLFLMKRVSNDNVHDKHV